MCPRRPRGSDWVTAYQRIRDVLAQSQSLAFETLGSVWKLIPASQEATASFLFFFIKSSTVYFLFSFAFLSLADSGLV